MLIPDEAEAEWLRARVAELEAEKQNHRDQEGDDREAEQLRDLIRHCWVHGGYRDCGYREMDGEMRRLYCRTIGREIPEEDRRAVAAGLVGGGDGEGEGG